MAIILGICLLIGWLYLWLIGHWFGRVLGFIILAPLCAFAAAGILTGGGNIADQGVTIICVVTGFVSGVIGAWYLAAWPMKYWQKRARELAQTMPTRIVHG